LNYTRWSVRCFATISFTIREYSAHPCAAPEAGNIRHHRKKTKSIGFPEG